ncbi:MAG TPA: alkaline phosphatase D family protein [Acidimicrobiales bacterium]|nr:alkaline phosphatase D family protein [Acidimicrobiales bacterium]
MRRTEPAGPGGPLIDRRSFLVGLAATALAAGCSSPPEDEETDTSVVPEGDVPPDTAAELPPVPPDLPAEVFALGVASGDPLPDSVILWTRVVSDPLADDGGMPAQPLPVAWEVARDRAFDDVVASGDAVAEPALAHSVHVDASGLEPDTWYWYRFTVGDRTSPVGRTRTAPGSGAEVEQLRFAFASCQDYEAGHFTAHEHLAREDVDLVLFLGDYIYERPPGRGAVRRHRTAAPVDLAGYRRRYGEVKADPALQAAHAHVPWLCTWDDHEVEGNYAGGHPGDPDGDEDEFVARRAAAYQAWYEHMPVRVAPPDGDGLAVHRALDWGDLARLYLLDGRQYRSDQPCGARGDVGPGCDERTDPDRTMLGAEQEEWLGEQLAGSRARWNVVGQQTVLTANPLAAPGTPYNLDQWDGYPAARRRLLDQLREVDNPVVLSGDVHASCVCVVTDDPQDPASPPAVPELVGTSITSEFPARWAPLVRAASEALPTIRYLELERRGYVVCEVTPAALTASFRYVATTAEPGAAIETGARWVVRAGDPEPRPA